MIGFKPRRKATSSLMKGLVFAFFSVASSLARAELSSTFDMNLGVSSLTVVANPANVPAISTNLQSYSTIDINYNLNASNCNCSLSLGFQEFLFSSQSALSFTRLSIGSRFYPFGVNGQRVILDSKAEARIWAPAPFVGLDIGMSNISIATANAAGVNYNMVSNDICLRFGNEIPIGPNTILMGHLLAMASLASNGPIPASYTGFGILFGIRFSSFD